MSLKIRYKLLNKNLTSYNDTQWKLGEWKKTDGTGNLCSKGWLHCYSNPILAILMNPLHADIPYPRLFKCQVRGNTINDYGRKEGWTEMRIVEEIPIPVLTMKQKINLATLCALKVNNSPLFKKIC